MSHKSLIHFIYKISHLLLNLIHFLLKLILAILVTMVDVCCNVVCAEFSDCYVLCGVI